MREIEIEEERRIMEKNGMCHGICIIYEYYILDIKEIDKEKY